SSDHWLFFNCANEDAWAQLTKLGPFKTLSTDPRFRGSKDRIANDKALSQLLSKTFRGENCQHWLATLNPAGINAAKNVTVDQFRHYQYVKDAGLIVTRHHPGIGSVDHLGNTISLSKTPLCLGRPASVIGAETNDVLREAGYSKAAIERLQVTGVIKQT
ncbi:CoA transferase, partial [Dehalococcoidia bacterium]|nr:CoA transferase [Dehalococcoidia bacterium]